MDKKLHSLLAMLRLNTRLFLNALEDVSDEVARLRPNERTNSIAFIALHLADSRYYLAHYLGSSMENPFASYADARSVEDIVTYPTLADILDAWQTVTDILENRLLSLNEREIRHKSSQKFPVDDDTVLGGLIFLQQHESYHIGQLGLLRKFFGLPPMRY